MTGFEGPIKEIANGFYDGPHATPPEAEEGPVFLGIKNVTPDGRLDLSEIRHVSDNHFAKWTRRVTPREGDIVLSYEATLHRYVLIPEGFHGCLGRRMALIRPNKEKVIPRFLHYYFLSRRWRSVVESNIVSGATVDRIPLKRLPDFEVQIPKISKQAKIVGILSAYDDLIENNRRRIELLEQSARLLYKEWFVHLRFPGHDHANITNGIPDGWQRKMVPEVIDINPTEQAIKGEEIRYFPMGALSTTGMTVDMSESQIRTKSTSVKFRNGDTLFARITPCLENGKTGFTYFLKEGELACGSTEFIVLRGREVSPYFTYCLARTHDFRGNAIKSMTGSSGRQRVQKTCFDEFIVPLPTQTLRLMFDESTEPIFKQIAGLVRQNEALTTARDLLLPRFMNGEIIV